MLVLGILFLKRKTRPDAVESRWMLWNGTVAHVSSWEVGTTSACLSRWNVAKQVCTSVIIPEFSSGELPFWYLQC